METLEVYQQQGCLFYNILAKLPEQKNNVIQLKKECTCSLVLLLALPKGLHMNFLKDQKIKGSLKR